jgi:exopolysaccharide biosynthesis polyprenyl glycosylphosphotransferase
MSANKKIHFEISERKILLRIFDVIFVLITLFFIGRYFEFDYFYITKHNFYWTIVLALYLTFIGTIFDMYNLQTASNRLQILKSTILTSAIVVSSYLLTPILTPTLPKNRLQIILFFLAVLISLLVWRNLYIKFLATNRFIKRVVFVGYSKKIERLVEELIAINPHLNVVGFVATDDKNNTSSIKQIPLEQFLEEVKKNQVSEIIVTTNSSKSVSAKLYSTLLRILESGVVIRQYAEVYEYDTNSLLIQADDKNLYKFFPFSRSNQNKVYLLYAKFFDLIFTAFGLLFLAFIIPIVFIFNSIWNKGPLFYTQERVGKNGIPFKIYKLRTMIVNAEKEGAVFATTNDSRITKFGKFLRKSRLDEIPQFINILKGEMAVIGPRPERPVFVDAIAQQISLYQTRHIIKPGLTGWAQVNYSYGENIEDSLMKLRYDLYYIKHRSLFLDINVIVKTLNTVFFFKGQ